MTFPAVPSPPPIAEALLESLGADPALTDEVLGDLAEEHLIRSRFQSRFSARVWYYREAFRVGPWLFRKWARRLAFRDARSIAGAVVAAFATAWVGRFLMGWALMFLTNAITDIPLTAYAQYVEMTGDRLAWLTAASLSSRALSALLAGYVAARIGRRAPLAHCIVLLGVLAVVMSGIAASQSPTLIIFGAQIGFVVLPTITLTAFGGILGALAGVREATRFAGTR